MSCGAGSAPTIPCPVLGRACPPPAKHPPAGPGWLHEIKHDGFRLIARRDRGGVRLLSRKGTDLSRRFPFVVLAIAALPARSCLIDGEVIVCDENGLAVFDLIRSHGTPADAVHCAFDLLELDGEDLRRQPLEERKELLAELLGQAPSTIVVNKHFAAPTIPCPVLGRACPPSQASAGRARLAS